MNNLVIFENYSYETNNFVISFVIMRCETEIHLDIHKIVQNVVISVVKVLFLSFEQIFLCLLSFTYSTLQSSTVEAKIVKGA